MHCPVRHPVFHNYDCCAATVHPGSLSSGGDDKVCIQFDEFWFDLGADNLRPELTPADQGTVQF